MGWNVEQHQTAARTLEPSNDRLLTAFLGGEPLPAIAHSLELPLSTLLERLSTPVFRELLATVARLQRTQQRLCSFAAPAIHALSTICKETPNLNHRRLAASQILRFAQSLNHPPKPVSRARLPREAQSTTREAPTSSKRSSESRATAVHAGHAKSPPPRIPSGFAKAPIPPQEPAPSLIRESPARSLIAQAGSAPFKSNSGILTTCLPRHSTRGSSRTTAPP